jgi:hypothetical protein
MIPIRYTMSQSGEFQWPAELPTVPRVGDRIQAMGPEVPGSCGSVGPLEKEVVQVTWVPRDGVWVAEIELGFCE